MNFNTILLVSILIMLWGVNVGNKERQGEIEAKFNLQAEILNGISARVGSGCGGLDVSK